LRAVTRPGVVEPRPGGDDRGAGVAGCLQETGHQVGVDLDGAGLGFQADAGAGEHIAAGGPPAAPPGVPAELDQGPALRGTSGVQVEHVVKVVQGDAAAPVLDPVQLALAAAEPPGGDVQ
jgi:hypothetical protein